jgi:hypothetical protein
MTPSWRCNPRSPRAPMDSVLHVTCGQTARLARQSAAVEEARCASGVRRLVRKWPGNEMGNLAGLAAPSEGSVAVDHKAPRGHQPPRPRLAVPGAIVAGADPRCLLLRDTLLPVAVQPETTLPEPHRRLTRSRFAPSTGGTGDRSTTGTPLPPRGGLQPVCCYPLTCWLRMLAYRQASTPCVSAGPGPPIPGTGDPQRAGQRTR